jgi:circadian clock protein KaiC
VDIIDVYTGPAGVLTGSARLTQENKDKAEEDLRKEEITKLQRNLETKRKLMEAQVSALQAEFAANEEEIKQLIAKEKQREKTAAENRKEMGRIRKEDSR